ncbi:MULTISPECIES: hypothetical protein [Yersinia]|uniref:hypothetical protein n=1 Tax=Yersinia TaxID=629 RepID=UPI0011A01DEE|nr:MULTISPECIES: hypothetical protein [Yersinia]
MKVNYPIAKDDEPGWLGKLASGKLGVAKTYLHFLLAIIFISVATFFAEYANWNFWVIVLVMVLYSIYIFNVAQGLWRTSKNINNTAFSILTKFVSVFSFFCGISSLLRAGSLVLLYLQS